MPSPVSPGDPYPLGATWDGSGTNFAVFSQSAQQVDLCLFDAEGHETRYPLPEVDAYVWHGYLEEAEPGQMYGYRVRGRYDPDQGLRANYAKLLLDPYARAVHGAVAWGQGAYSYSRAGGDDRALDETDSAPTMPKSIVVDNAFDWDDDHHPRTPWHDTVIYETHVRGLTRLHPEVPDGQRGTYAGVAHPAMVEHFQRLGITAVELMPVHQYVDDDVLAQRGLRNYWGYNSIGFFAPHNAYASRRGQRVVNEFKTMVRSLHAAGIEVILDVVYNHTAEGNHMGPTLSFRGLDNLSYYRLDPDNPRFYSDTTGTGNTLNVSNPQTLQLLMDSLRYWVLEMHVDGFRFDLAASLARQFHEVDRLSAFFDLIHQDPVISQIKLIAEPWDLGSGGYQVGNFPVLWSEWNGRYRDSVRDYWRQQGTSIGELAHRLTGSSDLYEATGRRPWASVNFVTAHDGFTLADLVAYNGKHNEANGDDNRDGTDDNRSWNCGAEGPTTDLKVLALRNRQVRNFLATLALSLGVPMFLGGDELGRTQGGNNNGYCQDNEVSWYDWANVDDDLLEWARAALNLRRAHPIFRRRRFFQGRPLRPLEGEPSTSEIGWFRPDGRPMGDWDWGVGYAKSLGVLLNGPSYTETDRHGRHVSDTSFYLALNAWEQPLDFALPGAEWGEPWQVVLDTADPRPVYRPTLLGAAGTLGLLGHHFVVLQQVPHAERRAGAATPPTAPAPDTRHLTPGPGPRAWRPHLAAALAPAPGPGPGARTWPRRPAPGARPRQSARPRTITTLRSRFWLLFVMSIRSSWEGRNNQMEQTLTISEEMTPAYARHVGERLRNIRRQQGLSLQAVEEQSDREFKASVLGAYERGERIISVLRLQRLARLYGVPVDQLLPKMSPEPEFGPDNRAPAGTQGGGAITIDLSRLERLDAPEREVLRRYIGMIQIQRGDFNGRLITIRAEDVRALARVFERDEHAMRGRIDELGIRTN